MPMCRKLEAFVTALLAMTLATTAGALDITADWTDVTTALNGQSLSIALGTPDVLALRGNAFPVIVAQDAINTMVAAARVSDAGGKVVAFNKEAYMQACGDEANPSTALTCRLAVNTLRWAAGVPASAANTANNTFRLAVATERLSVAQLTNIKTAATAQGFSIQPPTGYSSEFLTDVLVLGGSGARIADVVLTDAFKVFSPAEQTAVAIDFVQTQGAGLVLGGQAWSTGGNITLYGGNQLLAPLNCTQWVGKYGDGRSVTVATSPPDPVLFNGDLAAQPYLDHLQGTTPLPADKLTIVANTMANVISVTSFAWVTPASSYSAALWASFGSQLDLQLANIPAGWTCGSVNGSNPNNKVAVAYMAKRQTDLPAAQMQPFACIASFPGLPGAGATVIPSTVVTVNATYAGSYTGPMPPRGGTKWLSTGLWAPAGQTVTVNIPAAVAATLTAAGGQLGVQIGSHSDNLAAKTTWCRLPYNMLQNRWFTNAAGGDTITMASGEGGLMYITVSWGNAFGVVSATVTNAMQAPFFFKGVTTEAQWRDSLRSSPVPWAELGSDKLVITVPSASIATLDNPQAVVDTWDKVLDGYADLAAFSRDRARAERIVLDCDIKAGWMHAGYPVMAYQSEADKLLLPKWFGIFNNWGFFHELGHNHQWSAWTLPNQGEVTENLYATWASEVIMRVNRTVRFTTRAADQANYFATGVWPTDFNMNTGILQILQLQENAGGRLNYTGGWAFWSRFLARMQVLDGTPAVATDDAKIQTFVVEACTAANMNLAPFFTTWKFPVTTATQSNCSALPAFPFNASAPCAEECVNCCLPLSLMGAPCSGPVTIGNGTFNCSSTPSGQNCTGKCNTEYGGTPIASCWDGTYFVSGSCLLIGKISRPSTLRVGGSTSSTCVQVNGANQNSQRLVLATCTSSGAQNNNQLWISGTDPNTLRIQTASTSGSTFCLDVSGSGTSQGTAVIIYTCTSNNNQKWTQDTSQRWTPGHAPTMCLDTAGSSTKTGALFVINRCSTAKSQKIVNVAVARRRHRRLMWSE